MINSCQYLPSFLRKLSVGKMEKSLLWKDFDIQNKKYLLALCIKNFLLEFCNTVCDFCIMKYEVSHSHSSNYAIRHRPCSVGTFVPLILEEPKLKCLKASFPVDTKLSTHPIASWTCTSRIWEQNTSDNWKGRAWLHKADSGVIKKNEGNRKWREVYMEECQ